MALSLCGLLLTGCLIPTGSKVTSGQRYSKETLLFLDLPGTARSEVVATLGPPLYESPDTRALAYVWHETPHYIFVPLVQAFGVPGDMHITKVNGSARQWALFIALDEQGMVAGHEDRYIESHSLQSECLAWYHHRNK